MLTDRSRAVLATAGCGAVVVAAVVTFSDHTHGAVTHVAGRGDEATTTAYTSPTVPTANVGATAMSTDVTVTAATPLATEATAKASPPLSITPPPTCLLNGVSLPGGCH